MKKTNKIEDILELLEIKKIEEEKVETGILSFDTILDGGINSPSIIQIVGEHSTGKSSIVLQIAYLLCKKGKKILYIDSENKLTPSKLKQFGLDKYNDKEFFYCNEAVFSKIETILDAFIDTGEIFLVIIDSIPSLLNEGFLNINGQSSKKGGISITNNNSNYDSRPLGQLLKKYSALAKDRGFSMLLVNQYRCKIDKRIGTISSRYGPKYMDNICNVIIKVKSNSSSDYAKKLSNLKGCSVNDFEVVKSDCLAPKTIVPFCFEYGKGIQNKYDALYYLLKTEDIMQDGTNYQLKGNVKTFKGLNNFVAEYNDVLSQNYIRRKNEIEQLYKSLINKC